MVHDARVCDAVYATMITDETLMRVRATEVVEVADNNPLYRKQRTQRISDLSPEEKKAVYEFLIKEADRFAELRDKAKGLVQIIKSDRAEVENLEDDVNWYDGHIARFKKGVEYLRKLPDFPKNNYRAE